MHLVFMITGHIRAVEEVLNFFRYQQMLVPFKNPNLVPSGPKNAKGDLLKEGFQPMETQLRPGLLGTWELVIPEHESAKWMTALRFNQPNESNASFRRRLKKMAFREVLELEEIPEFKPEYTVRTPDFIDDVRIIPLGVRYDKQDFQFENGLVHEYI